MLVGSQTVSRLISVTLLCLLAILLCRHHDRDNEVVHRWFHVIDRTGSTASPVPRLRSCRSGQSRAEKKLASAFRHNLVHHSGGVPWARVPHPTRPWREPPGLVRIAVTAQRPRVDTYLTIQVNHRDKVLYCQL